MTLGFPGTGSIPSAIVSGLQLADLVAAREQRSIVVSPRNAAVAADLTDRFSKVSVAAGNQEVLDRSDTVVIAVRPQVVQEVLGELRFRSGRRIITQPLLAW